MTNGLWRSKAFVVTWQIVLALFGLSVLTSKSGFSIFGALLAVLAIAGIDWKKFFFEERLAFAILLLYPLAVVCGFFSVGGLPSALHTASAWPWPLLVLPAVIIKRRDDDTKIFLTSLLISLAVACLYCIWKFGADFHWEFSSDVRVPSFWDISRWGLFAGLSLVFLAASFVGKSLKQIFSSWKMKGLLILLMADFGCFILSNNRGPWLAFAVAMVVLFVFCPKSWKVIVPIFLVFGLFFSFSKGLSSRLHSIGEVQKNEQGQLTSKDRSNEGRFNMWKVAVDFSKEQPWFGTGFENTEVPLRRFLGGQSAEYREKYTTVEYSYRDQHSSPLSMLVQFGAVFSLFFWMLVLTAVFSWIKMACRDRTLFAAAILSGMAFHLVLCLFYTSFLSYEVVSFIPLLVLGRGIYGSD